MATDRSQRDAQEHHKNAEALGLRLVESLSESQIVQLHELLNQQWWGTRRSLEDVRSMLQHTSLMVGLVEVSTGRLVGFCRVLTDFVFRATVYDVMVTEPMQHKGLGQLLMSVLSSHPSLQRVSILYLCCVPEMFSFYERWGFQVYDEKTHWMIKTQRDE